MVRRLVVDHLYSASSSDLPFVKEPTSISLVAPLKPSRWQKHHFNEALTYDRTPLIQRLAEVYGFEARAVKDFVRDRIVAVNDLKKLPTFPCQLVGPTGIKYFASLDSFCAYLADNSIYVESCAVSLQDNLDLMYVQTAVCWTDASHSTVCLSDEVQFHHILTKAFRMSKLDLGQVVYMTDGRTKAIPIDVNARVSPRNLVQFLKVRGLLAS